VETAWACSSASAHRATIKKRDVDGHACRRFNVGVVITAQHHRTDHSARGAGPRFSRGPASPLEAKSLVLLGGSQPPWAEVEAVSVNAAAAIHLVFPHLPFTLVLLRFPDAPAASV
jgi:hypothetical protein